MKLKIIAAVLSITIVFVGGCQSNRGQMESAGERSDEIIDNLKDGRNPLHKKGTLEKVGDAVDETFDGK